MLEIFWSGVLDADQFMRVLAGRYCRAILTRDVDVQRGVGGGGGLGAQC